MSFLIKITSNKPTDVVREHANIERVEFFCLISVLPHLIGIICQNRQNCLFCRFLWLGYSICSGWQDIQGNKYLILPCLKAFSYHILTEKEPLINQICKQILFLSGKEKTGSFWHCGIAWNYNANKNNM